MKYDTFRTLFASKQFFSFRDLLIHVPDFDKKQLTRWVQNNKIRRITRGWYTFLTEVDESWRMVFANSLIPWSYISCEFALSFYSLIPEEAVMVTSVCTTKTLSRYLGVFGNYRYQSIAPRWLIGYTIIAWDIRMATPEKALIDFLYYHADYVLDDDFIGMRLIVETAQERMTPESLRTLTSIMENKRLTKQIEAVIAFIWWRDHTHIRF